MSEISRKSLYAPSLAKVVAVRGEARDVKTLTIEAADGVMKAWMPGQFAMFSVFGEGECPLAISSSPTRGKIECTLRRIGRVTRALCDSDLGDTVGVRGPYGRGFPVEKWRGRDIVFAAGGMGLAALRAAVQYVLDNRRDFGAVTVIRGAKSVAEMIYRGDLTAWGTADDCRVVETVDPGCEAPGWSGEVGLVPSVLDRVAPGGQNAVGSCAGRR